MIMTYFPGCTLYNKAKGLDNSTRAAMAALGVELRELPAWTCCGAVFPLVQDNYMGMVAPGRILATAAREGGNLVTVCSFCYNVLKRTNYAIQNISEVRRRLNDFLEENYNGETRVIHPLEICRDYVGFEVIRAQTARNLKNLKVACYYGCTLVRPASEMDFDSPENPAVMEELVAALGAKVVDYPGKTKCCGSYQVLHDSTLVATRVRDIVDSASAAGAELIVTTCPLCQFNLDRQQEKIVAENSSFHQIPVLYFTQLMGISLGLPKESLEVEEDRMNPLSLFEVF